jgi:6-pyruvoyltetrahydropterin/6-carboxytetrahydropterin synthase
MGTTITKDLEFDAAHRLLGHESLCANLHGHRYRIQVEVSAESLDRLGRVVDFGVVKARLGEWIAEKWDHACLVETAGGSLLRFLEAEGQRYYILPGPPTAELMAESFFNVAERLLLRDGVKVESVTVWETPSSRATFRRT